ncbi:Vi polysaccharide biosynthesis UDP-N-acetylglucosamine C-6 dehydrogenase TviB [Gammaproteobacteria bacterium]|nr:Vi polysaccharide biosynthesis UDP-N-acetylglucosamine C-6 dehydrogenase TviB [Gammaproteobacteria bacterium]
MNSKTPTIAVIGLGYVGLPLAVEFGKQINTIGYDIDDNRIKELAAGHDKTLEVDEEGLKSASKLRYTANAEDLIEANIFIVTVPTPIDRHKNPDLTPLRKASELIGRYLTADDIVIYESTVYPGATEEVCVPILAELSGLEFNRDFFVGYSPERINPGDKEHGVTSIQKVTSGSTPATADFVDDLYKSIITAGTYKASSVKVAEAAKVIENTQRDVNIALINELAMIFNRMNIDTEEVLKAAGTKWNFLPFRPGLVGGHCIGVDPYYLTHKAIEIGYHPEMILAGRRINDDMGSYVVDRVTRIMTQNRIHIVDSKILILGLTFKENCPDLRNTRVIDIINSFTDQHANVDVYDPWVDADEANEVYGFKPLSEPVENSYDAIVLAVSHQEFIDLGMDAIRKFGKPEHVLFDIKYMFPAEQTDGRL